MMCGGARLEAAAIGGREERVRGSRRGVHKRRADEAGEA
jgi:hypothetical protein